jgi:hypothetical protein
VQARVIGSCSDAASLVWLALFLQLRWGESEPESPRKKQTAASTLAAAHSFDIWRSRDFLDAVAPTEDGGAASGAASGSGSAFAAPFVFGAASAKKEQPESPFAFAFTPDSKRFSASDAAPGAFSFSFPQTQSSSSGFFSAPASSSSAAAGTTSSQAAFAGAGAASADFFSFGAEGASSSFAVGVSAAKRR